MAIAPTTLSICAAGPVRVCQNSSSVAATPSPPPKFAAGYGSHDCAATAPIPKPASAAVLDHFRHFQPWRYIVRLRDMSSHSVDPRANPSLEPRPNASSAAWNSAIDDPGAGGECQAALRPRRQDASPNSEAPPSRASDTTPGQGSHTATVGSDANTRSSAGAAGEGHRLAANAASRRGRRPDSTSPPPRVPDDQHSSRSPSDSALASPSVARPAPAGIAHPLPQCSEPQAASRVVDPCRHDHAVGRAGGEQGERQGHSCRMDTAGGQGYPNSAPIAQGRDVRCGCARRQPPTEGANSRIRPATEVDQARPVNIAPNGDEPCWRSRHIRRRSARPAHPQIVVCRPS